MSEWHTGWTEGYASARSEAQAEILRLHANNEKLRVALKPFVVDDWVEFATFTGSYLRAAAAAYKETSDANT